MAGNISIERRVPVSVGAMSPVTPTLRKMNSSRQVSSRYSRPSIISEFHSPLRRPSSILSGLRSASSFSSRNPKLIPSNATNENVKVAVRVVPHTDNLTNCWSHGKFEDKHYIQLNSEAAAGLNTEYKFDHFFDEFATNQDVYSQAISNIILKTFDGFNVTVFAYGMTGTGKTYSMNGTLLDKGIITRSLDDIFLHIQKYKSWNISLSYLEIYNEKIQDLLSPQNSVSEIRIREDSENNIHVIGATELAAMSTEDISQVLQKGSFKRKTASTDSNSHSSRSHAILRVNITYEGRKNTLSLIDLAGSERAASQSTRRKEGGFINKSLLTLGTVISKLTTAGNLDHIPYRDSKLTRILQDGLSGNSFVCLLATITVVYEHVFETTNTLKFASRVKLLPCTPKFVQPEKTHQMMILENKQLKLDNEELKRSLEILKTEVRVFQSLTSPLDPQDNSKNFRIKTLESDLKDKSQEIDDLRMLLADKNRIIAILRDSLSQLEGLRNMNTQNSKENISHKVENKKILGENNQVLNAHQF